MPTYEYTCKNCGQNIEVFQSFSAKPLKKHAECGGELQKVFHARGVVFKGSGWYAKDSKAGSTSSGGSDNGEKPKKSKEKEKAGATQKASTSESAPKDSSSKDSPSKDSAKD